MRRILIFLIRLYQWTLSPLLHAILGPRICRHDESCSDYAIRVIQEKGIIKGLALAAGRFLSCQPFGLYPTKQ